MIVNLIGPPGAGKSTFASRFVLEHPEFRYCPIDEYRIKYKNEAQAWGCLLEDVVNSENTVIETSGLSWRLNDVWNAEIVRRRRIYTIRFEAEPNVLVRRIQDRSKRSVPLPPWLSREGEVEAIRYFFENSHLCATPVDFTVYTDQGMSPDQQYQDIVNAINQARIDALGNKERRKERLDNPRREKTLAEL